MKILIVTDEPAMKMALALPLAAAGIEITEVPEEADVTLLDMTPECNFDTLASLKTKNVVLWARSIEVEFAFQASMVGIRGFVSKLAPVANQVEQLIAAGGGTLAWPGELVAAMLSADAVRVQVTRRESELITLVSRGLPNKDIAYQLGITEGTVKVYMSRLFDKLGVRSRHELGMYAVKTFGRPSPTGAPMPLTKSRSILRRAA